jgi:hypothetical protein
MKFTIFELDEIAKRATKRVAAEFTECGFANPPIITLGMVRAVMDAAGTCPACGNPLENDGECLACGR